MEFGIQDLCEANKLLSAIAELTGSSGAALSKSVRDLCSSVVLGGRKHNHTRLVELCASLGFVARRGDRLALAPEGKVFLSNNPSRLYELTPAQKEFLIDHFVFEGKLRSQSEFVFHLFIEDHRRGTWTLDVIDRPIPNSLNWFMGLVTGLGVLVREQSLFFVAKQYVSSVTRLRTAKSGPSSKELEAILGAKRKLGALGEVLVEDFEKKRLLSLGRIAEADHVSVISEIDTAAGFDIKSFDGNEPAYDYDRFIEVKTSADLKIRFNWSRNEYETAEALAERYWIYFCGGLNPQEPQRFHLVMIQNPAKKLMDLGFTIEPSEYLVQYDKQILDGKQESFGDNLRATIL